MYSDTPVSAYFAYLSGLRKTALDVCQVIIYGEPNFDSAYHSSHPEADTLINFEFDGFHFGVTSIIAALGVPQKKIGGSKNMKAFFDAEIGMPMEITKLKNGTKRETHLRMIGLDQFLENKDQRIVTPAYESALETISRDH